jgi:hypothetical protein
MCRRVIWHGSLQIHPFSGTQRWRACAFQAPVNRDIWCCWNSWTKSTELCTSSESKHKLFYFKQNRWAHDASVSSADWQSQQLSSNKTIFQRQSARIRHLFFGALLKSGRSFFFFVWLFCMCVCLYLCAPLRLTRHDRQFSIKPVEHILT